jgi:putative transposase
MADGTLDTSKLEKLLGRFDLSPRARLFIEGANKAPYRRVRGRFGNVPGRFPSRKMGSTIQYESHKVELPAIIDHEYNPHILAYWDQPGQVKLTFVHKKNRNFAVLHVPDFLVMDENDIWFEEWKTEADLQKLAEQMPTRYVRRDKEEGDPQTPLDHVWICPPGEAAAAEFGFHYRLRSSGEINWHLQDNLNYLDDYLRVGSSNDLHIDKERAELAEKLVRSNQSITLEELLKEMEKEFPPTANTVGRNADTINIMVVTQRLYVDLRHQRLSKPDTAHVFTDGQTAQAYVYSPVKSPWYAETPPYSFHIKIGSTVLWDGRAYIIEHIGESYTVLRSNEDHITQFPHDTFTGLVREGIITVVGTDAEDTRAMQSSAAHKILMSASPKALTRGNQNFRKIAPWLFGEEIPALTESEKRQCRRVRARFRAAEEQYGQGYVGVVPKWSSSGRTDTPFDSETEDLIQTHIEKYESTKNQTQAAVYAMLKSSCEAMGKVPPSPECFRRRLRARRGHDQEKKRKGKVGSYSTEPPYWELSATIPRHGNHSFHIWHMDHTWADIELIYTVNGRTFKLGRVWLTLIKDAYSRRILAVYMTFDEPSHRSCMMAIRECVRRIGRLPQILVLDGGKEFESEYFETLLAKNQVNKKTRPGKKPKFGSVIENTFGTTNGQFFHNLQGNTQLMREPHQVTEDINPKTLAIWALPALYSKLCEYCYEVYDTMPHSVLGMSPREAFTEGVRKTGDREHKHILYDENFLIDTMPTTDKGWATITASGVKIHYLYYWHDLMKLPGMIGTHVPVRRDPFNVGIAYAFIAGEWEKCFSEHYVDFEGRTEKEMSKVVQCLRDKQKLLRINASITATKLGDFLNNHVAEQETLLLQRMRDNETRPIRECVAGSLDYRQLAVQSDTRLLPEPSSNMLANSKIVNPLSATDDVPSHLPTASKGYSNSHPGERGGSSASVPDGTHKPTIDRANLRVLKKL